MKSKNTEKNLLVLVDGNALVHRAFHAIAPLTTSNGLIVNAVYGFFQILFRVVEDLKPTHMVVIFDAKGKTFRHVEFEEYKAHRIKQPDELYEQFDPIKEILNSFNIPILEIEGVEADDVIGSISHQTKEETQCYIVTGDHDALQLVNNRVFVYAPRKSITDVGLYDIDAVRTRYGFDPKHIIDYKALRGDTSDNIPGIKGIGEKTATDLIQKYGDLDSIYKALDSGKIEADGIIKERMIGLLRDNKKDAYLSKKLATILVDVPVPTFSIEKAVFGEYDLGRVQSVLQKYEFKSLMNRLLKWEINKDKGVDLETLVDIEDSSSVNTRQEVNNINQNYICIDSEDIFKDFFKQLCNQKIIAFDSETTDIDPLKARVVGMSFCWEEGVAYYLPLIGKGTEGLPTKQWFAQVKQILEDKSVTKIGHNIKYDIEALSQEEVIISGNKEDTLLMAYLLDPGSRTLSLDALAFHHFGYTTQPIEELIGVGKKQISMSEVELSRIAWYAAEDADMTWRLYQKLSDIYKTTPHVVEIYNTLEKPLLDVLVYIESIGCVIDTQFLTVLHDSTEKKIHALEKQIYSLAGREFNIGSPKQMQEILFDELKISTGGLKRTKTGISTAADELEKMREEHEIINYILEFRELSKLQSTYIDALPTLINSRTNRLHTSYNQAVTSTGRLSSSDPNLQNIPIRSELGKEIRKAFVAPSGYTMVSIDYSQMELRVVAHMADDEAMKKIFQEGKDVHTSTSAFVFGIDESQVTKDMRRVAKEVNFGIIYGMGAWGLAQRTGIDRGEAKKFIDDYFIKFKNIKKYLDETKIFVQKNKYVETLFGRRRHLPNIDSGIPAVRAAAEREAINMPIQGTAADIMKMGMISVYNSIKTKYIHDEVRMILTVHDELVFEVRNDLVEEVCQIVKKCMEEATTLSVPLVCEISKGSNWGSLLSF